MESEGYEINSSPSSLTMGSPAVNLLRKAAGFVGQATSHRMSLPDASDMLDYGPTDGLHVYREELAKFLSREYKDVVNW
jgi:DNA-binding transcriptional MocR family regulator